MKNIIKLSRLIGTTIIFIGGAFLIQHLPHSLLIISLGYIVFSVFWISLLVHISHSKIKTGEKFVWGMVVITGLIGSWLYYLVIVEKEEKRGRMEE